MELTFTDEEAVVLGLYREGKTRDEISKELDLGAGTVSRILEKWRQVLTPTLMGYLHKMGRGGAKAMGGAFPLDLDDLANAHNLAVACKGLGISFEPDSELAKALKAAEEQKIDWPDAMSALKLMTQESTRQGKSLQVIIAEYAEKVAQSPIIDKELESKNKELAEKSTLISKTDRYASIDQMLAEQGITLPADPQKVANCLANVAENDSDPKAVLEKLGELESLKAQNHILKQENIALCEQNAKEQHDLESRREESRKDLEAIESVKELHSSGLDNQEILALHAVKKASKIEDFNLLAEQITQAGGLIAFNIEMKSNLKELTNECQQRAAKIQSLGQMYESTYAQTHSLWYLQKLRPLADSVAGVGTWTKEEVSESLIYAIQGALSILPRDAWCYKDLERALYAVKTDFTIRDKLYDDIATISDQNKPGPKYFTIS